ncbi:MAG: ABC-F family ATP-binding cassette domain-containing protein, partial [Thermoplasmata archaeon]|nr:ABC-F family ATP-binding cassette domain-containing protein [Thermoplasmata archaeon]
MSAIVVNSVSKSFGPQVVLRDISFEVLKGQKIGLVGQNGTGKSTLLNIIYGLETADMGEIKIPRDVTLGYMTQESKLDDSQTLIEAVSQPTGQLGSLAKKITYLEKKMEAELSQEDLESVSSEYVKALEDFASSGGYGHPSRAEGILEKLGLDKRTYNTKVGSLSGGERTKARLARIIMEAEDADLLILDEPTNHLDMSSQEILQEAMAQYDGTIIIVSHNRHFVNRFVNKVLEIKNGHAALYEGNIEDYLYKLKTLQEREAASRMEEDKASLTEQPAKQKGKIARQEQAKIRQEKSRKINPLQKEERKAEVDIESLETRKKELEQLMADPQLYQ